MCEKPITTRERASYFENAKQIREEKYRVDFSRCANDDEEEKLRFLKMKLCVYQMNISFDCSNSLDEPSDLELF